LKNKDMPNLNRKSSIKIAAIVLVLSACSLAAWSVQQKYKRVVPVVKKQAEPVTEPAYNRAVFQKFSTLLKDFDFTNKPYTIAGTLNTINKADTTERMQNLSFLFSKDGNNCYYKLKNIEMLNAENGYMFIDHTNKKIAIAAHKDINMPAMINGIDKLQSMLQSEGYELQDKHAGQNETISLVNEHHVTCKEYAITYDTLSMKINRVYTRFTDITDVMNKNKERIVDMQVSTLSQEAHIGRYLNFQDVVKKSDGHWQLKKAYAGYQLIEM
jgi:DNA-binding cell septation regulator SpoVG